MRKEEIDKKFDESYLPTIGADFAPTWTCQLEKGEATSTISSIYLLAKFVWPDDDSGRIYPPATHPLYNKLWIFSIGYMPLFVKTDNEAKVF
jgi:hypothetical protein